MLIVETGQFAVLWRNMAEKLGLKPSCLRPTGASGADAARIEARLKKDKAHEIKAVCVVHNETSTGARSWIDEIRQAMDAVRHPALLMVDAVSSLAAMDFRHDEWGVDVTVSGSQKGLMLPPGLSFTAVSQKALAASKTAKLPRVLLVVGRHAGLNASGIFPYTPATGLLYGLVEAIDMLHEEGLDRVFARHERLAEAVRRAVRGWGLETWCRDAKYHSPVVTAVAMPDAHNADALRKLALEKFDIALGSGLNKLAGKAFRIGHLGYTNELTRARSAVRGGDDAGACRRPAREGGRRRSDGLPRRDRAARNRPRRLGRLSSVLVRDPVWVRGGARGSQRSPG